MEARQTRGVVYAFALCLVGLALNPAARPQEAKEKSLPAVKTDQAPLIDGDLNDAAWADAPVAVDFVDPLVERPAKDQTVARLLYDDAAIYVAIRAFDSQPDGIVARQTKDQVRFAGDDVVAFSIDPFHTHQFGDRNFFVVNPLGARFAHLAAGRADKAEWLGLWEAAAQRTEDGWAVEMKIPWEMLAYPDRAEPITMGINFDRYQQRTGEKSWWANVGTQEFLERDGHWVNVEPPPRQRELKLLPYAYVGGNRIDGAGDLISRAGLDVRYDVTPKLTFVGTVNPDFENVEQSVEAIDFSYGARFVPDRRPFFQEGRNVLNVWEYFDSRRISSVDGAVKLFGRASNRTSIGGLATFHRGGDENVVLRITHAPSGKTAVGAAFLGRREDRKSASVGFLEGETRVGNVSFGANFASTSAGGKNGYKSRGHLVYQGGHFVAALFPFSIHPDFANPLGFHPFTGIRGTNAFFRVYQAWRQGAIRSVNLWGNGTMSDRFDGAVFERTASVGFGIVTRSDYGLLIQRNGGRFEEFRHDGTFRVALNGRVSDRFTNYGASYEWGTREDQPYRSLRISGGFAIGPFTTGAILHFVDHDGRDYQHVITVSYDFAPSMSLGGRMIWRPSGRNLYLALRRSGYAGTDFYFIVGDPNSKTFARRTVLKVVGAF